MRNNLTLLLLFLISFDWCFATETEKLPEIPWRAIVESTKGKVTHRWETDISVKLFGNYNQSDSLMVANAISELSPLIKTIRINMSSRDRGNVEIYFIDSTNISFYRDVIPFLNFKYSFSYNSYSSFSNKLNIVTQAIYAKGIPENSKQNFITNILAFDLFPFYWFDESYYNRNAQNKKIQESIFRSIDIAKREKILLMGMQDFDKKLLKAVYSPDFEEKLKIAQKQFEPIPMPEWLKAKPYAFLLLPFGILFLLLSGIFLRITKWNLNRISNELLRFNVNGIIGLLFTAIIVALYFKIARIIQYNDSFLPRFWHDLRATIILIEIIGLISINLLRYVEILIHKNTNQKFFRVGLIFLSTGLIPFCAFLSVLINLNYWTNHVMLKAQNFNVLSYVFLVCMTIATFRALISYFIFKEKDLILENETKLSNLRELKTKAELAALHSRINPHFLYNSLNSIAGLAHEDPDKTEHMALSLSKLFRYSINRDQSDWTTFKEEMEMVKIYLEVEKVRFDDRLRYSVELPPELEDYKIPRFIIQPLVENAVKHGMSKSVESGQIKVAVTQEGRKIFISVSDDGPAFPKDLTPGFGIQSIYDKLEILYKDRFEMNFINSPLKQVLIKLS